MAVILAANCDRKHLENYKIGLENSRIFFSKRVGTLPCVSRLGYWSQQMHVCASNVASC